MAFNFNMKTGETAARELLIACLNTGTETSPVWSPLGNRVEDSSEDMDWSEESTKDILGNTRTKMKKPIITQSFDPWDLEGGDEAQQKIHQMAIIDQDAQGLCNMDMLIVHLYTSEGNSTNSGFAERYKSCMVKPNNLGGEGGGNIGMGVDVTYGGERTVGTATKSGSVITFIAGGDED